MVPYFPPIYPDELLYSVLARYHRHTCSTSPKRTLEDLYGQRGIIATVDLPGHLLALSRHLPPERGLTSERLAVDLTLFPYYVAFQPPSVREAVFRAMLEGPASDIHVRLGIAASIVPAPRFLFFCPECVRDAVARFGEPYWRRAHQLPGVLICPEHGVPLANSGLAPGLANQHAFIAATPEIRAAAAAESVWFSDGRCIALLRSIAERSAALLTAPPPPAGADHYRDALVDRGLATGARRVDQADLWRAYEAFFTPLRAVLPAATPSGWLPALVRKHRHAFHPLHHVLFGLLLDSLPLGSRRALFGSGPWPCLNPLAAHRGQPVITDLSVHLDHGRPIGRFTCSCGYVYSRNASVGAKPRVQEFGPLFDERLRALVAEGCGLRAAARTLGVDPGSVRSHAERLGLPASWKLLQRRRQERPDVGAAVRERWLAGQSAEPALSRKQIARHLPAEHAWLYRHDRAWLDAHSPPTTKRSPAPRRVDWSAVDRDMAATMRRAAAAVTAESPPCRVTRAELERRVGKRDWIIKRRDKLPETMAALAALTESVEAFQVRRVRWAAAELAATGPTPAWKIRRLAGLPAKAAERVEAMLAALDAGKPEAPARWS
ncbi:MAG TPA: TnsD family Tn7-like transposition protein [Azospirillaceae bacterium]|nr:TnsD family Tn7-like transposition protein [Azospirillaceae bacterium]